MDELYALAAELTSRGKHEPAWKIIGKLLIENPLDVRALVVGSAILRSLEAYAQSYHLARAATQLKAANASTWTALGHVESRMGLVDEAESHYKRGLQCAKSSDDMLALWINLSALYIDNGRFDKALQYVNKILAQDPTNKNALTNLGFCQLAVGNWEGWKGYHGTIGCSWRARVQYKGEPEWDGSPGKTVVVYADQGLGDEVSFASMVPDAERVCKKLILDCDGRLAPLFQRSFPNVRVYGTRVRQEKWAREDRDIEASLPLGQLGEFFRTTGASFPGTPYLVPCPIRVQQWRTLFAAKRKPCVGIAWTGGVPHNNSRNRRIALQDLLPVLSLDAHFVSLQYKDAEAEIATFTANRSVDLVQYPWATLTQGYDDTAALVAALDYVLCIQTAVGHTAGALGKGVTVLLPVASTWRYGLQGDRIPWYGCMRVIRQKQQGQWRDEIELAAAELATYLGRISSPAGAAARDDGVRDSVDLLCADRLPDHRPNGGHAPA
jgi:tetratricopeptide (TPR) repeat protein